LRIRRARLLGRAKEKRQRAEERRSAAGEVPLTRNAPRVIKSIASQEIVVGALARKKYSRMPNTFWAALELLDNITGEIIVPSPLVSQDIKGENSLSGIIIEVEGVNRSVHQHRN